MTTKKQAVTSKYMAGDIRHLINKAIQDELTNLPNTLAEIKDPVQRLNFLTKLMPFVCALLNKLVLLQHVDKQAKIICFHYSFTE